MLHVFIDSKDLMSLAKSNILELLISILLRYR